MRIPSGKTDCLIYFVAVDSTDLKTREMGLGSFTVYRSRNGGAATVYTTPTVAELSAANMPGVYALTIDEDTTIASTSDSEEMVLHITQASMAPVTRTIELYRRDTTSGSTLDVTATGAAGIDWGNVENKTTTNALTNTSIITTQKVDVETIKTNPVVNGGTLTFPSGATLASTTNISAGTITTATNVTTVNGLAANVITAASMNADASAEIADAVWDEDATGHQTQGTFGQAIGDPVADTNTIFKATVTDAAGATVGVDVVAVKAETASIQSDTDNIQTRIPAALVSGRIDASVGAMAADTLTASALAGDAVTEIQSGLATQASVNTIDDFLDTEVAAILAAVDTEVAAILADTNELQTDWANGGRLDLILDARASQTSVDDLPTNAELATALGTADDAVLTAIGDLPTNAELATALGTADDAVLAQVALVKSVTDKLDDTLEDDAGTYRFTTNALEQGPTGGGGGGLDAAGVRAAIGMASANLDTQLDALPTNAELATALGTSDDATLAQLALIKTNTDQMAFTKANELDVNIQSVNGATVAGTGEAGDEWGPV